jgi:hypothetical protein
MFCTRCGQQLAAEALFCSKCGSPQNNKALGMSQLLNEEIYSLKYANRFVYILYPSRLVIQKPSLLRFNRVQEEILDLRQFTKLAERKGRIINTLDIKTSQREKDVIIYCNSRREVEEMAHAIRSALARL